MVHRLPQKKFRPNSEIPLPVDARCGKIERLPNKNQLHIANLFPNCVHNLWQCIDSTMFLRTKKVMIWSHEVFRGHCLEPTVCNFRTCKCRRCRWGTPRRLRRNQPAIFWVLHHAERGVGARKAKAKTLFVCYFTDDKLCPEILGANLRQWRCSHPAGVKTYTKPLLRKDGMKLHTATSNMLVSMDRKEWRHV